MNPNVPGNIDSILSAIIAIGPGTEAEQQAARRKADREELRVNIIAWSFITTVVVVLVALGFWLGRTTLHP